jgi:WD40 repeat protein
MVVSYPMTTTVDVRSMVDGSPLTQLTHPLSPLPGTPDDLSGGRRVRGIVFSPDGKLLAISYADHEIELFRTDTWESVQLLQSNLAPLSDSLVITPDNQYLLTSGTLAIWRLIDGELLNRIPNIGDLSTFPLSPDGKLLATTDYANRTVLIYSFPDGRLLYSHRGLEAPASFSADGEYLIVGEQVRRIVDGTRLPADQEGAVLAAQQLPAAPPAVVPDDARLTELRHFPPLHGLLLPAVQQVLAWSQSGQMLSWYDLYAPTASQATLPAEMINRAVPAITNQALAVCLESQLAIVDLGTSEQLILDRCREKGALTFLTDGRTLARASNIGIDLVDLIAGKVVHNLRGHNNLITHLAASPDGQFLASGTKIGGDGAEVYIWKLENRTILQKIKVTSNIDYVETEVQSLAFSPDGSLLAIGGVDDNVKVHRVSDGWQLLILKTGLSALDLEISPDGSLLAAGNQDGSIYVWSLPTGDLLTILTGHVGPVNDILISPNGAALLSAGEDGTVRVWGVP